MISPSAPAGLAARRCLGQAVVRPTSSPSPRVACRSVPTCPAGDAVYRAMRFFLPPPPDATHFATHYGIPCYFARTGDGCDLRGTNVIADWLLDWWPELMMSVENTVRSWFNPLYECPGWPIRLRGRINRP